ncbi:MAG: hypothetical protein WA172_07880 [Terriglobales bacterium]
MLVPGLLPIIKVTDQVEPELAAEPGHGHTWTSQLTLYQTPA